MIGTLSIAEQYNELLAARRAMSPTLSQKLFVWSLLVMKVNAWVSLSESTFGFPQIFKYIMVIFCLSAFLYMLYQRPLSLSHYGITGIIVVIFSLYSLMLVAATFRLEARYLQWLLGRQYYVLSFVLPVFILFSRIDMRVISYMIRYSLMFIPAMLLILLYVLANINHEIWQQHLYMMHIFNFALPFVLLNIHYLRGKDRQKNMLIVLYLGLILAGAIYGRRGYVLDMIMLFFFYYVIISFSKVVSIAKKLRNYFFVSLALFVFILMLGTLSNKLYIFERGLNKDGWDDSRGRILEDFFADFGSYPGEWIWGRGLDGWILRTINPEEGGYGDLIENGYLYILLKAGGFYLFLMMFILLFAAYLGWFKSRNQLTKAASAIIIIHVIGMISFNLPVFNAEYAMVWISVVICFSREIRRYTEEQVKLLLNL
jgi:hypothetical protein